MVIFLFFYYFNYPCFRQGIALGHQSVSQCQWHVCSPWPSFLASTPGIFLAWDRLGYQLLPSPGFLGGHRDQKIILPRSLTETSITLPHRGPWSSVDHTLSRGIKAWLLPWSPLLTQRDGSAPALWAEQVLPTATKHHLPVSPSHWGSIEFTGAPIGLEMGRGSGDTFLSSSGEPPSK